MQTAAQTQDLDAILPRERTDAVRVLCAAQDPHNADHDVGPTLAFYQRRYVRPLADFREITADTVVADIGCGYGWLALAFALATPARVIAVEPDADRVRTGRRVAELLGVADRIDWRIGGIDDLPLRDREADVVYCVEVLEHIRRDPRGPRELCRVCDDLLVATTPNRWFPVVAHDTRLPFCHMLPRPLRRLYARLAGRLDREQGNLFWSPPGLDRRLAGFRRVSGFLHYASLDRYLETFPYYMPYDHGYWEHAPGGKKLRYYRFLAPLGGASHYFLPNLAGVFRRERAAA